MKKFFTPKILLSIIVLLAFILRFYQLGTNPPGLNWDEAALGYNAYSLGVDGRDEFGKQLPWQYLESYGDYKPPLYSYLAVVPVKILGLDAFTTRFPSALLGVLTVALTYFLVKEIFFKKKDESKVEAIALVSTLFMAISPWHVMLSRGAFEANVSTFFIVGGIYSFLVAVNRKPWFLILSAIMLSLSFYTFNTARVFVPLMVITLALIHHKVLVKNYKQVIIAAILGLILLVPLFPFITSPQAKLRFQEVNIFSDISVIERSNQMVQNDNNAVWSKVLHNRRILYGVEFLRHYADNLNPKFLFISGDGNPRFSTQDLGSLYLLDLPFLIFGLYMLVKKKEGHYLILPIWFLLGIIPVATARETPHALRIETVIPTLQVLTAIGFVEFVYLFKKRRKILTVSILALYFFATLYFYHGLISHYPREYSSEWQYSYREAVKYIKSVEDTYESITFTTKLGRPYIFFLTYNSYDPKLFRQNSTIDREALGFVHVRAFDKYRFEDEINVGKLKSGELYVDTPERVPTDAKVLKNFYLLDGTLSLVAYEVNR